MGVDIQVWHTESYMVAAYIVTGVVLVGYALILWRRVKKGPRP